MLVEIFMHLFAGVEPQQLLDAPRLLAQQQVRVAAWGRLALPLLGGQSSSCWMCAGCPAGVAAGGQCISHEACRLSHCTWLLGAVCAGRWEE